MKNIFFFFFLLICVFLQLLSKLHSGGGFSQTAENFLTFSVFSVNLTESAFRAFFLRVIGSFYRTQVISGQLSVTAVLIIDFPMRQTGLGSQLIMTYKTVIDTGIAV